MRPLFPFYGSKWRDAKRYGAPVFGHVVEPFAGSAGYSCYIQEVLSQQGEEFRRDTSAAAEDRLRDATDHHYAYCNIHQEGGSCDCGEEI